MNSTRGSKMTKSKPSAKNSGMQLNSLHKYGFVSKVRRKYEKAMEEEERADSEPQPQPSPQTVGLGSPRRNMSSETSDSDSDFPRNSTPLPSEIKQDNNVDSSTEDGDLQVFQSTNVASEKETVEVETLKVEYVLAPIEEEEQYESGFPQIIHVESLIIEEIYDNGLTKIESNNLDQFENGVEDIREYDGEAHASDRNSSFEDSSVELNRSNPVNIIDKNDIEIDGGDLALQQLEAVLTDSNKRKLSLQPSPIPVDQLPSLTKKRRRTSAGSSISGNGNLENPPKTMRPSKSDDMPLSKLIETKRWEQAIQKIWINLDGDEYPTSLELASLIKDCILRVRRVASKQAAEVFNKLSQKCNEQNLEQFDFVLGAFGSVSFELDETEAYKENSYWPIMIQLLQNLQLEASNKMEEKHTFRFLSIFVELVEKLFNLYVSRNFNVRLPMVVKMFEGLSCDQSDDVRLENMQKNVGSLTNSLIQLQDYAPEIGLVTKLLTMLSTHYYRCRGKEKRAKLLCTFSSILEGKRDFGIPILQNITGNDFGRDVCLLILRKKMCELSSFSEKEQKEFLELMGKTKLIRNHEIWEENVECAQLVSEDKCELNRKGETILHILCGDPKKNPQKHNFDEVLTHIQTSGQGDVNIRDYGGNVMLHEASDYGRIDRLETILKRCCTATANETNDRILVNPIWRNNNGNTPLHLAAKRGKLDVVKVLVQIIGDKLEYNLFMRNKQDDTPLTYAKNPEVKEFLRSCCEEGPSWETDFCFPNSPIRLSQDTVVMLKNDMSLQQLIERYSYFGSKKN